MQYKIINYVLLVIIGLMFNLPASALETRATAQVSMLVNTCVGCHGTNGSSVGPATPSIAGMRKPIFIKAMQDLKSGKRPSTVMALVARGYTDKEIEIMADFFSKQKIVRYPQNFDAHKAQRGKVLHNRYCNGCHKIDGKIEPIFYSLAGQWMPYLRFRLSDFEKADSSSHLMSNALKYFVRNNSKESLEDIIHYYGSKSQK